MVCIAVYDMFCMYLYILICIGMYRKNGVYVLYVFVCIAVYLYVLTCIGFMVCIGMNWWLVCICMYLYLMIHIVRNGSYSSVCAIDFFLCVCQLFLCLQFLFFVDCSSKDSANFYGIIVWCKKERTESKINNISSTNPLI